MGNVADATLKAKFPFGHWHLTLRASDGYAFTSPVGTFQPNAFGLYDMHGNAEQWCADWWNIDYYAKSAVDDPTGPKTGPLRVIRGGSWGDSIEEARSAAGAPALPRNHYHLVGFRVASTQ